MYLVANECAVALRGVPGGCISGVCVGVVYGNWMMGGYGGWVWMREADVQRSIAPAYVAVQHAQHAQVTELIVFGVCHRLDAARP